MTRYWLRGIMGGVLVVLLAAAGLGLYEAGVAQGVAEGARNAGQAGATVGPNPYGYGYGWWGRPHAFGFLWLVFPFLFFVFLFGLVRAVFGRPYRGWHGDDRGPGRYERLEALHRRLHESESSPSQTSSESPSAP